MFPRVASGIFLGHVRKSNHNSQVLTILGQCSRHVTVAMYSCHPWTTIPGPSGGSRVGGLTNPVLTGRGPCERQGGPTQTTKAAREQHKIFRDPGSAGGSALYAEQSVVRMESVTMGSVVLLGMMKP